MTVRLDYVVCNLCDDDVKYYGFKEVCEHSKDVHGIDLIEVNETSA